MKSKYMDRVARIEQRIKMLQLKRAKLKESRTKRASEKVLPIRIFRLFGWKLILVRSRLQPTIDQPASGVADVVSLSERTRQS